MDISFIRLTAALMLREVRSRGGAVMYAFLAIGSCVAGFSGLREWPAILLATVAASAVLQTTSVIAADARSEWMAPLAGFGYSGGTYVRAIITARAVQSGLVYAFAIVPFLLIMLFSHPSSAISAVLAIPQSALSLAALCAFAAIIALVVRDASWAVALASVLLVGPTIYVIAFTAMHHVLPSARTQTLLSLHVPPYTQRPDINVYWKLGLYIGVTATAAAWIGRKRIGRFS